MKMGRQVCTVYSLTTAADIPLYHSAVRCNVTAELDSTADTGDDKTI